ILDVLIIGGGPAGLAAAIAAKNRGLRYLVLEKGALVHSLDQYTTDTVFFTTPELLEIGGFPFVSPFAKPTRQEALRYYRRVAHTAHLDLVLGEAVTALRRGDDDLFQIEARPRHAPARTHAARAVVIATGA